MRGFVARALSNWGKSRGIQPTDKLTDAQYEAAQDHIRWLRNGGMPVEYRAFRHPAGVGLGVPLPTESELLIKEMESWHSPTLDEIRHSVRARLEAQRIQL